MIRYLHTIRLFLLVFLVGVPAGCNTAAKEASCSEESLIALQQACIWQGGTFDASTKADGLGDCGVGGTTSGEGTVKCKMKSSGECSIVCELPEDWKPADKHQGTAIYDDDGDCFCESSDSCVGSVREDCSAISPGDCNDQNRAIYPGAVERCDDLDNDCDAATDENDPDTDEDGDGFSVCTDDCDDLNENTYPGAPEICDFVDNDCDGWVDQDDLDSDGDGDGFSACYEDCDDSNADISPDAIEVCDGVDNDCNGDVDAEDYATDGDGDGFSVCDLDCDDTRAMTNPGAAEVCDGFDNDCNGAIDDIDADADGYSGCEDDCNDMDPTVHPGALEVCDGVDNDCDGLTDAFDADTDEDGDGYSVCDLDCDDTDSAVHPGQPEVCDGVDNDCNGDADAADSATDKDGDGYSVCALDCNDADPAIHPDAVEICDGVDNDCNGATDAADLATDGDGDGYSACDLDCDDTDAAVNPDAVEVCDGIDNDCDGAPDGLDDDTDGDGDGYSICDDDCDDEHDTVSPAQIEICDGIDNDCDDLVDEADPSAVLDVWYEDADDDGYGDAATLTSSCDPIEGYVAIAGDCNDADVHEYPGAVWYPDNDGDGFGVEGETVTACARPILYSPTDDDCDDTDPSIQRDEFWYPDEDGDGYGDSTRTPDRCEPSFSWWVQDDQDCNDLDRDINPEADDAPGDGIDQNCDGGEVTWSAVAFHPSAGLLIDSNDELYVFYEYESSFSSSPVEAGWLGDGLPTGPVVDAKMSFGGPGRSDLAHVCALDFAGTVTCSGSNEHNECFVPPGAFSAITVGKNFSCALDLEGEAVCWGDVPFSPPAGSGLQQFEATRNHWCAIDSAGFVSCETAFGACWRSGDVYVEPPVGRQSMIAVGTHIACALSADGHMECWGESTNEILTEMPDASLGPWLTVDVGADHACAINDDQEIFCWGKWGETGPSAPDGEFVDVQFAPNADRWWTDSYGCWDSAAGYGYLDEVCAIDTEGYLHCWNVHADVFASEALEAAPTLRAEEG